MSKTLEDYDKFDPRVKDYSYSLPGQDARINQAIGDDYQINTPIGQTGSNWVGTTTKYQAADAYGNPTGTFNVKEGGARDVARDIASYAAMAGGLGALGPEFANYFKLAQAGMSAAQGDYLGAAMQGLPAGAALTGSQALSTAGDYAKFLGAVKSENPFAIATGALNLAGMEGVNIGGVDINTKDIQNADKFTKAFDAFQNGNEAALGTLLTAGGALADSKNTELAGRAINALTSIDRAIETGNPNLLISASRGLTSSISNLLPTGGTERTGSSSDFVGPTMDYEYEESDPLYSYSAGLTPYEESQEPTFNYGDTGGVNYLDPYSVTNLFDSTTEDTRNELYNEEPANPADYNVQDMGSTLSSSFYNNPDSTYASTWQTVGSDRVMVQDDGTAIGINTETGDSYSLTPDEVKTLSDNGLLNSKTSGYTEAISGTTTSPTGGGTGSTAKPPAAPPAQVPAPAQQPGGIGGFDPRMLALLAGLLANKGGGPAPAPVQLANIPEYELFKGMFKSVKDIG